MVATIKKNSGLTDRNKKIIAISAGSVFVIAAVWWAFYRFTTVAPPDLKNAPQAAGKLEQVVEFLGNERGITRLSGPRQEAYLLEAYQVYGHKNPEARAHFIREMNQMSTSQRQVLNNVIFDIAHRHVMENARQYASLPPSQQRPFLDKAYGDFEKMRAELGGSSPGDSLSEPLRKDLPGSSDEMMKVIVDRTDGKERAEAKPFVDAMAAKYKEQQKKTK